MAQAKRDENRVTTLLGVSSVDLLTPTTIAVDPNTHSLLSIGISGDNWATKVTTVGSITYVGLAAPGSVQSDAVWQAKKVDQTTGTIITWADGDADFNNVATDLSALSYS